MNDKAKIVIAVVCLALAGTAVAWQMGVFSSGPKGGKASDYADENLENVETQNGMEYGTTDEGMTAVDIGNGRVPLD